MNKAQVPERELRPRRAWLACRPVLWLLRLLVRRETWGPRALWFHVYRWGSKTYGDKRWYSDWHVLIGTPFGHRSFYLLDAPDEEAA